MERKHPAAVRMTSHGWTGGSATPHRGQACAPTGGSGGPMTLTTETRNPYVSSFEEFEGRLNGRRQSWVMYSELPGELRT